MIVFLLSGVGVFALLVLLVVFVAAALAGQDVERQRRNMIDSWGHSEWEEPRGQCRTQP